MSKKVSNLEVLVGMCREYRLDRAISEIAKWYHNTLKWYHNTLDTKRTYLLNKPFEAVRNLTIGAKAKIGEVVKEGKEFIGDLSFRTTFQDYRDTLFASNFMPTYQRIHPDLEVLDMRKFGDLMGLLTELGVALGLAPLGRMDGSVVPFLSYIGVKVLTHGGSAFYEKFRETKQRLETPH